MKNTLLFPDKDSLDVVVGEIPFETKVTAYEKDTDTSWFSSYIEKPIVYNTVDLGLPSGLLWSDKNIGARTIEDSGLYFQWGDTVGYTAEQVGTDKQFASDWSDYKFGVSPDFTRYNDTDRKTVLDLEDDAAHVLMGDNWRLPTQVEINELITKTDLFLVPTEGEEISGYVTINGYGTDHTLFKFAATASTCNGMKFCKKGDHSTYLFVPAVGYAYDGSVQGSGVYGYFWSSLLYRYNRDSAGYLYFDSSSGSGSLFFNGRYYGWAARGVRPQ